MTARWMIYYVCVTTDRVLNFLSGCESWISIIGLVTCSSRFDLQMTRILNQQCSKLIKKKIIYLLQCYFPCFYDFCFFLAKSFELKFFSKQQIQPVCFCFEKHNLSIVLRLIKKKPQGFARFCQPGFRAYMQHSCIQVTRHR